MSYQVLARKWRPKNFLELAGQDSVRRTLLNGLRQNRVYPVLLFTGPRGTGKTSTARILAKSLRCPNQKDFIPCDQCEDCLLIQDSRNLDVIEIDGASNNGVDAVRDLRDTASYMPSSGSWKIYIIDEVHMLSNSAFNALLKTFEEPPGHVLFIMATTEIRKIPETILSRAQRLDFHLLPPPLIKSQLEKICKKEKLSFSEDFLWMIAKQARGSLRDAQSLLDQMITFCGGAADKETAAEYLGLSDPSLLLKAVEAVISRSGQDMLSVIEGLRAKSGEPRIFLQSLLESIRNLLFLKKNPENKPALALASQEEIEEMKKQAARLSGEELHFLFDMILKGEKEMAFCHDSRLALEVLLLRLCSAPRLESLIPLKPCPSSAKTLSPAAAAEGLQPPAAEKISRGEEKKKTMEKPPAPAGPSGLKKPRSQEAKAAPAAQTKREEGGFKPFEKRFDFLKFLKEKEPALSALVENLNLKEKPPLQFCFSAPEKFSYLKNKISDPACRKALEDNLTEFLRSKERVKIDFDLDKKPAPSLREEERQKEKDSLMRQAAQSSFVKEVKNLFEGDIKPAK